MTPPPQSFDELEQQLVGELPDHLDKAKQLLADNPNSLGLQKALVYTLIDIADSLRILIAEEPEDGPEDE